MPAALEGQITSENADRIRARIIAEAANGPVTADASERLLARGTLLLGEPEVTNVEAIGQQEAERVLALVAGAEGATSSPVATAVLRAARAKGIRPDAVRSPSYQPGLGVTAIAGSGQQLVVGSRALMLRERVSVALAETKITDLEAMSRTVLLVALGAKLIGNGSACPAARTDPRK